MNESTRIATSTLLVGVIVVTLAGCASQDLGLSATPSSVTPPDSGGLLLASDLGSVEEPKTTNLPNAVPPPVVPVTSLVSRKIDVSPTFAKPDRNPIVDLPANADLRAEMDSAPGGVLLDFHAEWCGPCRQQGKLLHQVEDVATKTGTTIIKINVDEHPDVARALSVSSLPTLMMVRDGRVTHRQTGVATPQKLADWMQ